MTYSIKSPRKLIEVALPLDTINAACAYEKMPGIGAHPRGIHLWWARRPLAAARAVIFAQLVNDPGMNTGRGFKYGVNKKEAAARRKELFKIIEELVLWENSTNETVLERARAEIRRSWREVCELNKDHPQAAELFNPEKRPGFHDPFAGGGAIPLEAQRLGLESYASDLNPVAVLINKAMIEIPPKFAGRSPVGPRSSAARGRLELTQEWPGASGLAEDVRRYGQWMRDEAVKRIGHLYPPVKITPEMVGDRPDLRPLLGQELKVIAWLWARTVRSPNPAFAHVDTPLASTFILANKDGKEAFVQPIVEGEGYRFVVKMGTPPPEAKDGTRISRGSFRCLLSGTPFSYAYVDDEANAGRLGARLMAVVAEGSRHRVYLSPTLEAEAAASSANPTWKPETVSRGTFASNAQGRMYGFKTFGDYFTPRQLIGLTALSDLVEEAREKVRRDAIEAGFPNDDKGISVGGSGATAYAQAVSIYLAFAVNRCADFSNSMTRWVPGNQKVMNLFAKQAIAMTWDYPEASLLADTVGGFGPASDYIADCVAKLSPSAGGFAAQSDAQSQTISRFKVISTDPPYYDNVGYADLSDFFYVWLRRSLRSVFPEILATLAVPKAEELIATQYRHGSKEKAEAFFLHGMTQAIHNLAQLCHPEGPVTIYYAFKQSETSGEADTSSPGWETFLTAVLRAGFAIVGTWPLRSEQEFRMIGIGNNALASSIVLVCRKRGADAQAVSRREFLRELNTVLPEALDEMTKGAGDERSPVAPVDLSQAIIGPGMAVFSKYAAVLEADGSPMSVRTALQLINHFLAQDDFDPDTQFCLNWFEQRGWSEGPFGEADTLSRAKGASINVIKEAGVLESGAGIVRLLSWSQYPDHWDPQTSRTPIPIWGILHHLIRALRSDEGETGAGRMLTAVKAQAESVRQLAYRLYTFCERKGWVEDARAYNELITSWTGIEAVAGAVQTGQGNLFE